MFLEFVAPFVAVGLAELGDKTQLALFLLSSRVKNRFTLWVGAVLGFAFVDGFSVVLGAYAGSLLPLDAVKSLSGALFILFGILMIRGGCDDCNGKKSFFKSPLLSSFALISVSEFGDKTQVAAGVFAAKGSPVLVFLGAISSLAILSALAIWFGARVGEKIDHRKAAYAAGAVFILIGLGSFLA